MLTEVPSRAGKDFRARGVVCGKPDRTRPLMPSARNLRDLLAIRDAHHAALVGRPGFLGSAVGYKFSESTGQLTEENGAPIPAVLLFVEEKLTPRTLQRRKEEPLPSHLTGPRGMSCATDVVTGRRPSGQPNTAHLSAENRALCRELDEGDLGGIIGGMPIARSGIEGSAACVVRHRSTGKLGLLTNAHVAAFPGTRLLRPSPRLQSLGTTTFSRQVAQKAKRKGAQPLQLSTRIDAALVELDSRAAALALPGVYRLGPLEESHVLAPDEGFEPLGREVISIGHNSGRQRGRLLACAYRWLPDPATPTRVEEADYLILGEGREPFAVAGDSGKLILMIDPQDSQRLTPVALLWGGQRQQFWRAQAQDSWCYATAIGSALDAVNAEIWR